MYEPSILNEVGSGQNIRGLAFGIRTNENDIMACSNLPNNTQNYTKNLEDIDSSVCGMKNSANFFVEQDKKFNESNTNVNNSSIKRSGNSNVLNQSSEKNGSQYRKAMKNEAIISTNNGNNNYGYNNNNCNNSLHNQQRNNINNDGNIFTTFKKFSNTNVNNSNVNNNTRFQGNKNASQKSKTAIKPSNKQYKNYVGSSNQKKNNDCLNALKKKTNKTQNQKQQSKKPNVNYIDWTDTDGTRTELSNYPYNNQVSSERNTDKKGGFQDKSKEDKSDYAESSQLSDLPVDYNKQLREIIFRFKLTEDEYRVLLKEKAKNINPLGY